MNIHKQGSKNKNFLQGFKKDYIYPPETNLIYMKRTFLSTVAAALIISTLQSQTIKSPDEFPGYEPGTQFTYHHRAVDYFYRALS